MRTARRETGAKAAGEATQAYPKVRRGGELATTKPDDADGRPKGWRRPGRIVVAGRIKSSVPLGAGLFCYVHARRQMAHRVGQQYDSGLRSILTPGQRGGGGHFVTDFRLISRFSQESVELIAK